MSTTDAETDIPTAEIETDADAFAERLVESVAGAFETYAVYLGDRLGYYAALAAAADDGTGQGTLTPGELAARVGADERYTREWCEQQAVTGVLAVEDAGAPPAGRRYHLPAAHAEALLDEGSEAYVGPLAQTFVGAAAAIAPVGQTIRLALWAVSSLFFVALLYVLANQLSAQAAWQSGEVAALFSTLRNLVIVLWTAYPIVWLFGTESTIGLIPLGVETAAFGANRPTGG